MANNFTVRKLGTQALGFGKRLLSDMAWLHIVGAKATCRVSKYAEDSGKSPEGPEENFLLIMEINVKSEVSCSVLETKLLDSFKKMAFHP